MVDPHELKVGDILTEGPRKILIITDKNEDKIRYLYQTKNDPSWCSSFSFWDSREWAERGYIGLSLASILNIKMIKEVL